MEQGDLYCMLFGSPVAVCIQAGKDPALERLDEVCIAILDTIAARLGANAEATTQCILELGRLTSQNEHTFEEVSCKRAMLLCALWKERDVRAFYEKTEKRLVDDLSVRVLPLVMPKFFAGQCQAPDSLVVLVGVLATA